jgi:hypothetical protein
LKEGKCIKNVKGWLILPEGGYIPRHIIEKDMMDHFEKWHCQNPGQLAKAILS